MSDGADAPADRSVARVRVTIDGEGYVLRSPAGTDHVQRCAAMVDARIHEVRAQGGGIEPPHRVALLAALSLAHDLLAEREAPEPEEAPLDEVHSRIQALVQHVEDALKP